ncbi:MarR family winged helix-turn-helix transcriptional regulator [Balneatrix alpica]|uniref:MarR family winged helix-turn-helix transcriptional regulator n=1 Tax=Balneatrix alpica TaxID=75684 RepID=A0ABV5ZCF3_9GAMM|nr:MarR family transcriptional regulator [Balneatrix alpica]
MPPKLRLNEQICFALYSASNAVVRRYRPILEPLGLTYPQYLVMLCLWENDQVNIRHISEHTLLDAGTLTPILKRLEEKGLLARQRSGEDERQKVICLTTAGQALAEEVECAVSSLFADRPLEEQQAWLQLRDLCQQLRAKLDE